MTTLIVAGTAAAGMGTNDIPAPPTKIMNGTVMILAGSRDILAGATDILAKTTDILKISVVFGAIAQVCVAS